MSPDGLVTVAYGAEAGIPDGATLDVAEIASDSDAYAAYLDSAAAQIKGKIASAAFYDIHILNAEGEIIQPAAPVLVGIGAKEQEGEIAVLHFAEHEEALGEELQKERLSASMPGADELNAAGEETEMMALMKQYQEMQKIRNELAKKLGNNIVI